MVKYVVLSSTPLEISQTDASIRRTGWLVTRVVTKVRIQRDTDRRKQSLRSGRQATTRPPAASDLRDAEVQAAGGG